MTTPHNSSLETSRTKRLEELIHKLEHLSQSSKGTLQEPNEALELFDGECEQVLKVLYGPEHERLQSYKYATLGEAEAIVNLPESARCRLNVTSLRNPSSKGGWCCRHAS